MGCISIWCIRSHYLLGHLMTKVVIKLSPVSFRQSLISCRFLSFQTIKMSFLFHPPRSLLSSSGGVACRNQDLEATSAHPLFLSVTWLKVYGILSQITMTQNLEDDMNMKWDDSRIDIQNDPWDEIGARTNRFKSDNFEVVCSVERVYCLISGLEHSSLGRNWSRGLFQVVS